MILHVYEIHTLVNCDFNFLPQICVIFLSRLDIEYFSLRSSNMFFISFTYMSFDCVMCIYLYDVDI